MGVKNTRNSEDSGPGGREVRCHLERTKSATAGFGLRSGVPMGVKNVRNSEEFQGIGGGSADLMMMLMMMMMLMIMMLLMMTVWSVR